MSEQSDLTGVWAGLYTYPGGSPSVSFDAVLIEGGSLLSGTVHEPDIMHPGNTLFATLAGTRSGSAVQFTKAYQDAPAEYGVVEYEGSLSADSMEIEGRWTIAARWRGTFLMIRNGGKHNALAKALETQT